MRDCEPSELSGQPDGIFEPGFDMPETAKEALQVIQAWGKPTTMTFDHKRAARCAELLQAPLDELRSRMQEELDKYVAANYHDIMCSVYSTCREKRLMERHIRWLDEAISALGSTVSKVELTEPNPTGVGCVALRTA